VRSYVRREVYDFKGSFMILSEDKKIYLTAVSKQNIEQLRQWRNNPELRQFFREYREISKETQEKWFEEKVLGDPNQINFEIHDNESGKLIGHCGIFYIKWVYGTGEFGIYIGDNNFRGKGYGKSSLISLVNYGFETLSLHRIFAEVYSNNDAIKLYKKIGFKQEGILRQHVYKNGKYLDAYMIGLLKDEWSSLKENQKEQKENNFPDKTKIFEKGYCQICGRKLNRRDWCLNCDGWDMT